MNFHEFTDECELLVRSRYPIIVVDTWEYDRTEQAARRVASDLSLHFHSWSRGKGLARGGDIGAPIVDDTAEPVDALRHVEREGSGVLHFPGLGRFFDDPVVESLLLAIADRFRIRRGALFISGGDVRIPDALRQHAIVLRMPAPDHEEYRALMERVIREHSVRMQVRVELTAEQRTRLLHNLYGLSLSEAEKILARLILVDGALCERDIPRVAEVKRQAVEQDGLLTYWQSTEGLGGVAGLAGLKAWLETRRACIDDPDRAAAFGLPFPKGILLTGVPGCGKSLSAKAVAFEWGLPLLRLDPGVLFDKYVGDTEKNFRRALATAERMAPIVLWIDELEKAFSPGGDQDGGVAKRVFGSFLSWLQDRDGDVFVVATSNDVSVLPPEFIRKGRFDEVFFVDLPDAQTRRSVFEIHLRKRRLPAESFDLDALSHAAEGFSGAEIEQAVIGAMFSAFGARTPLGMVHLLREIQHTQPLSRTMAERLQALRSWAQHRTVNAAGVPAGLQRTPRSVASLRQGVAH